MCPFVIIIILVSYTVTLVTLFPHLWRKYFLPVATCRDDDISFFRSTVYNILNYIPSNLPVFNLNTQAKKESPLKTILKGFFKCQVLTSFKYQVLPSKLFCPFSLLLSVLRILLLNLKYLLHNATTLKIA